MPQTTSGSNHASASMWAVAPPRNPAGGRGQLPKNRPIVPYNSGTRLLTWHRKGDMAHGEKAIRSGLSVISTIALVVVLAFLFGGRASATHVEPEEVRGSPSCSDYTNGGTEFIVTGSEWLHDDDNGRYTDGTFVVDLVFYPTDPGWLFDWSANLDVDVVVAKGGSNASVYVFDPALSSHTGLHGPFNDTDGRWYLANYISFCYQMPPATTTTAEVKPTTATTQPSVEDTTTLATTTTKPAEVLPTVVTTSVPESTTTKPAEVTPTEASTTSTPEVLGTEVLPFTGMSSGTIWLLGLSLLAAGSAAVFSSRRSRQSEE